MGEVAESMTKKKKKKGRPSLLDLQKRSLKQQQQQQQQPNPNFLKNPNSLNLTPNHSLRSTRRNPNSDPDRISGDYDDDDDERKQKKHKLLLGLNSRNHHYPISSADSLGPNSVLYGSDSNAVGENPEVALKRRKISAVHHGSNEMGEKVSKATDTLHGSLVESGPTTPLPDKKLLVFILDRLQKKDTYGVYSEPVDPEELPDYHDIVQHPMDFATVRKKLDGGAYANLEQFEKDVFLICSNAMQYNSPDTIYFRQARSMLELAKKDFENLRQESDDSEPQPKIVRRGRPPGKTIKKSLEMPFDRLGSDFSSGATLATGGDNSGWSNAYNLRKGTTSQKFRPADTFAKASNGPQNNEVYASWSYDWENEFPASVVKAVMKYGKKQFVVDENRRDTYKQSLASGHEPSVLTTLEGEMKQLIEVGLNSEHGYARSLAQFAADLGPGVWKIASRKIERVLPNGLEFGPGWVGENKAVEQQHIIFSGKQKSSSNSIFDDHSSRLLSPATSGADTVVSNRCSLRSREDTVETNRGLNSQSESTSLNTSFSGIKFGHSFQNQPKPLIHSDNNSFSSGFGFNSSPQMGVVRLATPPGKSSLDNTPVHSQMLGMVSSSNNTICSMPIDPENSIRLHSENPLAIASGSESYRALHVGLGGKSSWQGLSPYHKQDSHVFPPDLNVRFLPPGSPNSNMQIGSPQQPDLALQL